MAYSSKIKPVALGAAALLALALIAGLWTKPEEPTGNDGHQQQPEAAGMESTDGTAEDSDDGTTDGLSAPRTSLLARQTGKVAAQGQRSLAATEVIIPHNVVMADYKRDLWRDVQANPPSLEGLDERVIDADLAYKVYMFYGNCSVAPRTDDQAEQRLQRIENRVERARGQFLDHLEGRADQIINEYELCSLIPPEQDPRLEAVAWLSKAVYLGHEIAEVQYYDKAMGFILRVDRYTNSPPLALQQPGLVLEFKDTARFAFARALDKGHPEAYLAKSQAVLEGLVFPRDPLLAYAYALRAELAAASNRTIASDVGHWKQEAAKYLTTDQIAEARQIALEMHSTLDD